MERKQRLEHLLAALDQVIQILEQGEVSASLSVLKACYEEAQSLLGASQDIPSEVLQSLSTRVRSAIHPGMMGREVDVARIALGLNMLSRVA